MESDLSRRTTSYLSGCTTPPVCFPLHEDLEYTRFGHNSSRRNRPWRSFLSRLVRETKNMGFCGIILNQKSISFNYDAVSYSQNFDEGCHVHEDPRRRSLVYPDVRWDFHKY